MTFETQIIGDCTLYRGDCMEVLPTLGRFDAVITDPPYGIADLWNGVQSGKRGKSKLWDGDNAWDTVTLQKEVALSVSKGVISIIWGGNYYDLPPSRGYLIWDKCQKFSNADSEYAWCSWAKTPRTFRLSRIDAFANSGDTKEHPTQKPLALMKWCIEQAGNPQTILDPFMGSGTTGVAAIQLGRTFTGIEREAKYFDIACKRIEQAYAQGQLFPVEVSKQVQLTLG